MDHHSHKAGRRNAFKTNFLVAWKFLFVFFFFINWTFWEFDDITGTQSILGLRVTFNCNLSLGLGERRSSERWHPLVTQCLPKVHLCLHTTILVPIQKKRKLWRREWPTVSQILHRRPLRSSRLLFIVQGRKIAWRTQSASAYQGTGFLGNSRARITGSRIKDQRSKIKDQFKIN